MGWIKNAEGGWAPEMKIQSKDKEPEETIAVPEAGRLFGQSFHRAPL
jgi:hypothetical protein